MNSQHEILRRQIRQIYRRWKTMVLLKGGAITLLIAAGALLTSLALDTAFELSNALRLALLLVSGLVFLAALSYFVLRPLFKAPSEPQLARYVEERHPELEDRLVSAVELGNTDAENPRISAVILQKLLEDTHFRVKGIDVSRTVDKKDAVAWSSVSAILVAVLVGLIFSNLDLVSDRFSRVLTPWAIPVPINYPQLTVTPGDARIPANASQEIRAELHAFESETATLYFTTGDTSWHKTAMDLSDERTFVSTLFDVQDQTKYYVKAGDQLSAIYTLTTYKPPKIKRVDLTFNFPEYTGLETKREKDSGDIWAPEGTVVKITAVTDKPVVQGQITVDEGTPLKTRVVADTLVTASLTVSRDAYYTVRVVDSDDLANDPPPQFYVHAIPDQPPLLTVDKPGRDAKASMVEEVPVRVRVQDDFGVSSLKLYYTVSGGEEHVVTLKPKAVNSDDDLQTLREYTAEHLFYLENLGVAPGDFLTYYVEAYDQRGGQRVESASTDIFFVEVRPFEASFFRPLSQQGGGGGGGGFGGRLSETQKQIVVATWKLVRKQERGSQAELAEETAVILESQENLKQVAENVLFQMEQRSLFTRESSGDASRLYSEAIQAMEEAVDKLRSKKLEEALPPERRAYARLLAAEALMTEYQLQSARGRGVGPGASLDELARLFEDDMDKLKNKYETMEQNLQQQRDEQINEALRKVRELARRQQELNQRARDLARQRMAEEEKKRRIEELRRQQENLQREMQDLNRQMNQMQRQDGRLSRDLMNDLRQASSEMNRASNDLRRESAETAAARGRRALNRLRRMENRLRRNLDESLRREYESLAEDLQQLTESQKELTRDVEQAAAGSVDRDSLLQAAQHDQKRLQEDFGKLRREMRDLTGKAVRSGEEVSRELSKFTRELESSHVERKMQSAEDLLKQGRLNSALQAERDIQTMLERLSEKMGEVRVAFAESEEERLELALDQTQELRDRLERLQRRPASGEAEEISRQERPERRGASADRPMAGPGESGTPPPDLTPEEVQQWREALSRASRELEQIGQSVMVDSTLRRDYQTLSGNVNRFMRNFGGGDPNKMKMIESMILEPLRSFEAELAQKLEFLKSSDKLHIARDENIPPEYQELVEKYYEALSKMK